MSVVNRRQYSDAYTVDGIDREEIAVATRRAPGATDGGRVAYKRAFVDISGVATVPNGTEIRFAQVRSGDRPISMFLTSDGGFAADTTLDMGLWHRGANNDGIQLRRNMYVNKKAISSALNRFEFYAQTPSSVQDEDRGIPYWKGLDILGTVGGVTYGADPMEMWDLTGYLINSVAPGVGGKLLVEMYYLPEAG